MIPMVHVVEQALTRGQMGAETLLVSDLNTLLAKSQHQHNEDLATAITNCGLVDQTIHLIPRRSYIGKGGWSQRM